MLDQEAFGAFMEGLRASATSAGWLQESAFSVADLENGPDPGGAMGPVTPGVAPAGAQLREPELVIDHVIRMQGAGWIRRRARVAAQTLLEPSHVTILRTRLEMLVQSVPELDAALVRALPATADNLLLVSCLLSVLLLRRWCAAAVRLGQLVEQYEVAIALEVLIEYHRLRRTTTEVQRRRERRRGVRVGRNVFRRFLVETCVAAGPFGEAHHGWVEALSEELMAQLHRWRVATISIVQPPLQPPTPEELVHFARLQEIQSLHHRTRMRSGELSAERQRLIRERDGEPRPDRAQRAELQERIRTIWEELPELNGALRALSRERSELEGRLGRRARARIEAYLGAERRGAFSHEAQEAAERHLREVDERIAASGETQLRFGQVPSTVRRGLHGRLLTLLLRNQLNMGLELYLEALLRCAQLVERDLDIGIAAQRRGSLQWLTYPKHGAVDMNGAAGHVIYAAIPTSFRLPARLLLLGAAPSTFTHVQSEVRLSESGSSDLQDIFGKLAGAIIRSEGQRDVASRDIRNVVADAEGQDLAPAEVVIASELDDRRIDRLMLGLLAQNLTDLPNARAFDEERAAIADDLERAVARRLGLPYGTIIFRRDERVDASMGRTTFARIVQGVPLPLVRRAIKDILRLRHSEGGPTGREDFINRIWRLALQLLSAGALPHRDGNSLTVEHTLQDGQGQTVIVEAYYSHLHSIEVRAGAVGAGARLGRLGLTGNAINPHLHLSISVSMEGMALGDLLPWEFFPRLALPSSTRAAPPTRD